MKKIVAFLAVSLIMAFQVAEAADVKVGAVIRIRPEFRDNDNFNSDKDDKIDAVSQRILLNVKAKVSPKISALISLQDVRVWGQTCNACTGVGDYDPDGKPGTAMGGSAEIPRNPLASNTSTDLYQAWFLVKDMFSLPVNLKIGRQTLVYGDQRLLGHLGWKDQARSFDAFKATVKVSRHKVDLFYSKINETEEVNLRGLTPKDFQTSEKKDENLFGMYAMLKLFDPLTPNMWKNSLDIYYLVWEEDNIGRNVNTYGFRLKGNYLNLDYTGEFVTQSGDWASGVKQSASAMAVKAGYTFQDMWMTRLGVEFDSGSGDSDPSDGDHKTFVFPFHTNHAHYGYQDFFSWGNMQDISFSIKTKPMNGKVMVKLDYHIFELAEANDKWLSVVGNAPRISVNDNPSNSTEAGTEIDLTVKYPYTKNLLLQGGYSVFSPGEAAKERSGGSDDATWGYMMFLLKF
jgi:hypothetical protein